ncbi:hypothetical protein F4804DRAFT_96368 [Jackrogersella minutella]|nr:hypothetical protein F4804DRAFT_96368 [Jackrogersella minutella]
MSSLPEPPQAKMLKSILKKSNNIASSSPTSPAAAISPFPIEEHQPRPSKPTARELAIQQALLIQQQREREDLIQDSIIELSHLPLPTTTPSSSSSSSNASLFQRKIRLFQPSEYEDLIAERNALNKCGYALCPAARTRLGPGGEYKLHHYGRADFAIVPRAELERWCSRDCARRAMYVKVQLVETAAAERAGLSSIQIELLDEDLGRSKDDGGGGAAAQVARELRELEIADKQRKAARDAKELALERGDAKNVSLATKPVTVTIREKKVVTAAQEPSLEDDEGHLVLEGYKTKFDPKADPEER